METELDCGQSFKNHYESSKFAAEALTQKIQKQVPTTIIRPGIVTGNSRTGETVKFDGPYFIMRYLDKFAHFPIPYPGKGEAFFNLVPVDYIVTATCYLAENPISEGKVYHLTDPHPYHAKQAFQIICEALTGKKLLLPFLQLSYPGCFPSLLSDNGWWWTKKQLSISV